MSLKDQTMAVLSFRKANLSAINKTTNLSAINVPMSDGTVLTGSSLIDF